MILIRQFGRLPSYAHNKRKSVVGMSNSMSPHKIGRDSWRYVLLIVVVFGSLGSLLTLPPIPQDATYHTFVDTRMFFGIPNCLDVVSNLPFLLVGCLGLRLCFICELGPARHAWTLLFVSLGLVSAGSAYYHWNPNNDSLVWDRLPMTVGFMSLFAALVGEYIHQRVGKLLLWPAVLIGLASVLYWYWADDLRLYVWVQLVPLLLIPVVMLMFGSVYTHDWLLLIALGWYVIAKVAEAYDGPILNGTVGVMSGHSMKHLFAAAGGYSIYLMLSRRNTVEDEGQRYTRSG